MFNEITLHICRCQKESVTSKAHELVRLIANKFTYFEPLMHFATCVPNITGMSSCWCLWEPNKLLNKITHDAYRMTMTGYHGTPGNLNWWKNWNQFMQTFSQKCQNVKRTVSHSRRCTNGEKSIRHEIHGYVICYTLNKWALRPQTLQSLPAFYCSALCRSAQDRRWLRYLGHCCFLL